MTFAEGIPASLSRPGRALAGWLHWIDQRFPQRLLVEMIGEGLLNCDDDISFSYLVRLLRPIAIGFGADNYLPRLDEQIAPGPVTVNFAANDGALLVVPLTLYCQNDSSQMVR